MRHKNRFHMFLMLIVMPENQLSREQVANLQEMASGFGVLLSRQMETMLEESEANGAEETQLAEMDATEKVVNNPQVIDYLESCLNKQ
jgi:hypothetical protein